MKVFSTNWTDEDIVSLDTRYAEESVSMHARPLRSAMDILGHGFMMGPDGNPDVDAITEAYRRLFPEVDTFWPGMGAGLVASLDRVRKIRAPVIFGTARIEAHTLLGFDNREEWLRWCRNDRDIAAATTYAAFDMMDLAYGVDVISEIGKGRDLWTLALSNLSDVASTLSHGSDGKTAIQPICLTAELSLKAVLHANGESAEKLKSKFGHKIPKLCKRMVEVVSHPDDELVLAVSEALPDYVASRYEPVSLSRLDIIKLALGAQFISASAARRQSGRDMTQQLSHGDFPGPRMKNFYL